MTKKNWAPVLQRNTSCCAAPGTRDQLSRNDRSFLLSDGCFNFRKIGDTILNEWTKLRDER
jgi:hypothetical protein